MDPQLSPKLERGQTLIIAVILITIFSEIVSTGTLALIRGMATPQLIASQLVTPLIRLLISGALGFFLYMGYGWARWLLGILSGLGGFVGLLAAAVMYFGAEYLKLQLDSPNEQRLVVLFGVLVAICLLYLFCSAVLIFSGSVRAFQRYQRMDHTFEA